MSGRPKSLTDAQERAAIDWYENREYSSAYCRRQKISRNAFYNALRRVGVLPYVSTKDKLVRSHVRRILTLSGDNHDQQR